MQLERALLEIATIRERVESAQVFRGFRAQGAALSAALACLAAGLQTRTVPDPTADLWGYVLLWSTVVALSIAVHAVDLVHRWRHATSEREGVRILSALRALLPSLATGALATLVIVRTAPELGWTLPAVWALLFAQGVFASAPMLPRGAWWVGVHYVSAGLLVLMWGRGDQALAGWTMALTFAAGQLLTAGILYFSLERRHAAP